jgi:hypothetical protein
MSVDWRPSGKDRVRLALRRLGLEAGASRLLTQARRTLDPEQRRRDRAIWEDYRSCRDQWRRVAAGCPMGDPARPILFVSSFATVFGRKLEGALSLVSRIAGYQPHFLELDYDPWGPRYHSLFAPAPIWHWPSYHEPKDRPRALSGVNDLIASRPSVRDLMGFGAGGVDVGRIALSNILNRRKFRRLDLSSAETLDEVEQSLRDSQANIRAAERMLDRLRPACVMLLEKGLSPAAEIVGVALARGIPVIQYVGSHSIGAYVLKRYTHDERHQHPFSLSGATWDRARAISWGAAQETQLMQELTRSYEAGTWFNRKFLHQGKEIKAPEAVRAQLGLDPLKKTAAVFSHVLWDATFFYGEGLFDDYETWLVETVRAACANDKLNWIIKLHPDLVWKLRYEGYTGELRDLLAMRSAVGELPAHVKVVLPETDISTHSFFGVVDYGVTVRGTVGIELACHGIPVVTAGTGRYSGLGFTVDSATPQEYLARLAHLDATPPPTIRETELARRFAHVLFQLRPWRVQTFAMVKLPMDRAGDVLDTNLAFHAHSAQEFCQAPDVRHLADWLSSGSEDYVNWEEGG